MKLRIGGLSGRDWAWIGDFQYTLGIRGIREGRWVAMEPTGFPGVVRGVSIVLSLQL
jgi:hypothetical protein